VEPPADLNAHLLRHGYSIKDYKQGYAEDKHSRSISIGKVLNKTKAPKEIVHKFLTDPQRQATQKEHGLHIVISRHPHDVAGCSTNQGWTSCLDMNDTTQGSISNLKADVKYGIHVAYLTHKDDKSLQKPIARVRLLPFISHDKQHIILRPDKTYGSVNESFHKIVHKWSEKHFPFLSGKYYKSIRPDGIYSDHYNDNYVTPTSNFDSRGNHILFNQNDPEVHKIFARSNDEQLQDIAVDSNHDDAHKILIDRFSNEKHGGGYLWQLKKTGSENIKKYIENHKSPYIRKNR
jgi:hypothetical protein